jgi:hypothetical protein
MRSHCLRVLVAAIVIAAIAGLQRAAANGGGNPIPPPSRVFSWDKATSTPLDALPRFRQVTQSDHQGG